MKALNEKYQTVEVSAFIAVISSLHSTIEFEVTSRGRGYFEDVTSIALIPESGVRVEAKVILQMYFLRMIKLTTVYNQPNCENMPYIFAVK